MQKHILVNLVSQTSQHPTGIARGCFGLLEALAKRGHFRYTFKSTYPAEQLPDFVSKFAVGVVTVPQPRMHILSTITQIPENARLARSLGIDGVINIDNICALFGGPPSVIIAHDLYTYSMPDSFSDFRRKKDAILWKCLALSTGAILANSQSTARDIQKYIPATSAKMQVVYHDSPMPLLNVDPYDDVPIIDGQYVLVVGAASPNKNLKTIAMAMKQAVEKHPNLRLVHVGSDPNNELSSLTEGNPTVKVIRVSGVDDSKLGNLYRHAICLANASIVEGFCLPIIEAQRNLCPVVCSERSAAGEVGGEGAILYNPMDPDRLAKIIDSLIESPMLRDELRTRGLKNAERFSWDRSAGRIEEILDQLISEKN